jgi:glycosyltransferase domain-containing protein
MTPPLVTIGILTYNRAHLLGQAINSAVSQSYSNLEIIVSDDNSKDNTEAIVREYERNDSRIRYIRRRGVGMTQNFVDTLNDAQGEYFMWLCDDDYLALSFVAKALDFLQANSDYSTACGTTKFMLKGELQNRTEIFDLVANQGTERVEVYFKKVISNIILYGLMRRQQIKNLIYPDTFGADLLWSCQVAFLGKTKILPDTFFYYSIDGISQQTSNLKAYYSSTSNKQINPYEILRSAAIQLILKKDSVFQSLAFHSRLKLAANVWWTIRERFCMPSYEARFRKAMRIRTRIKNLMR